MTKHLTPGQNTAKEL